MSSLTSVLMTLYVCVSLASIVGCSSANTNTGSGFSTVTHDTVRVQVLSGEVRPVTGYTPVKRVDFSRIGQVATFHQGEIVELIIHGIDMNQVTLQTETNPLTNEVIISTISIEDTRVVLRNKCDIIERRGITRIPAIDVDPSLENRKIVIVPIFNDSCNVLGYQIRFDNEERDGCMQQADLTVYKKCVGKGKVKTANKSNVKTDKKCLEDILFGIPCPK